jgi:ribosomal protein L14
MRYLGNEKETTERKRIVSNSSLYRNKTSFTRSEGQRIMLERQPTRTLSNSADLSGWKVVQLQVITRKYEKCVSQSSEVTFRKWV